METMVDVSSFGKSWWIALVNMEDMDNTQNAFYRRRIMMSAFIIENW